MAGLIDLLSRTNTERAAREMHRAQLAVNQTTYQVIGRAYTQVTRDMLTGRMIPVPAQPAMPLPATLTRQAALQPSTEKTILDEYGALAAELGVVTPKIAHLRLEHIVREMGLAPYDLGEVEAYMHAHFPPEVTPYQQIVRWQWWVVGEGWSGQTRSVYDNIIPIPVLHTMKAIKDQLAVARFEIAAPCYIATSLNQDPFLAVSVPAGTRLVIEQWDEPGFTGKRA